MPEKLASSSSSGAKKTKEITATVPSRDPTGGQREDSEISTTNFFHGSTILEFINFEMEIVSESDLRGSFIVSEKSALVFVCVFLLKLFPSSLGTFFLFSLALSLSLSLSQFYGLGATASVQTAPSLPSFRIKTQEFCFLLL
jgi:hypothetical protein